MDTEIDFEDRGSTLRFKLGEYIQKPDFKKIVDLNDVWYFKGWFYLRPHMKADVERVLNEIGVSTTTSNGNGNGNGNSELNGNGNGSSSKVLETDLNVITKISKVYNLKTHRVCNKERCPLRVYYKNGYRCPKHGYRMTKDTKKVWYLTGKIDIDGEEELILIYDDAFTGLLRKLKMSKRDMLDKLKGLRGELYGEQLDEFKGEIEGVIDEKDREYGLTGDIIEWKTNGDTVVFYKAIEMMTEERQKKYSGALKFIEGELKVIEDLVKDILPDHEMEVRYYGDIPVLILNKKIGGDTVSVILRAPVGEYGKAYHLSIRVNGVHMFPATPVEIKVFGHTVRKYSWRVYHTENWAENIAERLRYIKDIENRALVITNKMKEIEDFRADDLLSRLDLTDELRTQVKSEWSGGNLLEFCELITKKDGKAGLTALKKSIEVIYKEDYPRWLVQEELVDEMDLDEILNSLPASGRLTEV
jgi:hypothetical protein